MDSEHSEPKKRLTVKQEKYAELIANGGPLIKSYIAAGYAPLNASVNYVKTINNPLVKAEIHKLQQVKRDEYAHITRELIVEELRKIQSETSSDNVRLKAIQMLCKIMGFENTVIKIEQQEPLFIIGPPPKSNKDS